MLNQTLGAAPGASKVLVVPCVDGIGNAGISNGPGTAIDERRDQSRQVCTRHLDCPATFVRTPFGCRTALICYVLGFTSNVSGVLEGQILDYTGAHRPLARIRQSLTQALKGSSAYHPRLPKISINHIEL